MTFYLMNLPYFLGGKLPEYLDWFVANYPKNKRYTKLVSDLGLKIKHGKE